MYDIFVSRAGAWRGAHTSVASEIDLMYDIFVSRAGAWRVADTSVAPKID